MGAAAAKASAAPKGAAPAAAPQKPPAGKGTSGSKSPKGRQTPKEAASGAAGAAKDAAPGGSSARLSPQEAARLAAVHNRARENQTAATTHQTADAAVADASGAAVQPQAEADGKALGDHAGDLEKNPPADPEIEAKIAKIKEAIEKRRPLSEDDLPNAKPREMAQAAGESVSGDVKGAAQGVQTGYDPMGQKPAGTTDKPVTPMPPVAPAPGAPVIDAATAAPTPANPAQAGVEADKKAVAANAKQAKLDRPEVKDIKEGPVADAAGAQKDLDNLAVWGPDEIVKSDKELRASATADFKTAEADALKQLKAAREKKLADVESAKDGTKTGEEGKRAALGLTLAKTYQTAEDQVRAKLKPLVEKALQMWEDGIGPLSTNFENALGRVDTYIKRHKESALNRIGDFFLGLPDWIVAEYESAQAKFVEGATGLARTISSWVNGIIRECQNIISAARASIQKEIDGLDPSLKEFALQEQAKINKQFDALAAEADGARKDFNKQLGQKLFEVVKEKNDKIQQLREMSKGLVQRFEEAIKEFIDDPLRAIINGLLRIVGIPPDAFWALVAKFGKVIDDIADRPMVFANNLVAAIKLGFEQFKSNFLTHVVKGLFTWLTSKLKDAGVQPPKDLSLQSMLTLFLQIMGVSWPKIRAKLVKYIGEKNMRRIELAVEFLTAFIKDGWDGVWKLLKEKLDPQQLVDAVISAVTTYLIEEVVKKGAEYILSLFNPAGIVYQALKLIYQAVSWIVDNAAKIFTLIESVVNGAANIMAGAIGGAATMIENALGAIVPIVIDLLAKLAGLGGLPDKVKEVVGSLQAAVDKAIDRVIEWVASKIGLSKEDDKKGDIGERVPFEGGGESHSIYIKVEGSGTSVMIASSPTLLNTWLERMKAKAAGLKDEEKKKDAIAAVEAAQAAAKITDEHSDAAAAARKATETPSLDMGAQNETVIKDEKALADAVKKVADLLEEKAPPGHPTVDSYASNKKVPNYQAHHVPPKALARWIAKQLADLPAENKFPGKLAAQMRTVAGIADRQHTANGPALASILVHETTHIRTSDEPPHRDFRVHHGKRTQELLEKLLPPNRIIRKSSKHLEDLEDVNRQLEELKEGPDLTEAGKASTQFFLTELTAAREKVELLQEEDLERFLASIADVFQRAWTQSFAAVRIGLAHSGSLDGTESAKEAALGQLQTLAPNTWAGAVDSTGKVTKF